MPNQHWLQCNAPQSSLHKGSFIPYKVERGLVYDLTYTKCAACQSAKAHICTPGASSKKSHSAVAVDKFTDCLEGRAVKKLKRGYTKPGDCISADHYMSVVPGCLSHTYGHEKDSFTCGTLFVYHASTKKIIPHR